MGVDRQPHARDPVRGRAGSMSQDVRALLAATAADVCEVVRAPYCALSSLHGDDAFIAAVQGARSHGAPHPGTSWHVSDVPPARQAVITGRAVTIADHQDPRLTAEQRAALTGDPGLVSLAFIPLLSNGLVVGLMVLGDSRPRELAEAVVQLGAIARLAAAVLAQDERLDDLARAADDLTLVLDTDIEAQSRSTGPEQVLRVIGRRLAELCHTPLVDIFALEGEDLRCVVSWQRGAFRPDYEGTVQPLADWPLTRAAAVSGRLEIVSSLEDPRLPAAAVEQLRSWGIASFLTIPLLSHGRVIGVAEALDCVPRDFAEVVSPARALGEIAAHILDKALLLEELERRNRVLHEIVALGARVNQTTEPSGLARFVAERLTEVLGATCCEIYKIERGQLRCLVSLDTRPGFDDPAAYDPIEMSEFPSLERAAKSRDLLVFASADDPRLSAREREIYKRWDFASELSIPLFSDDRLVGLIDVFDQRARDYAEHLDFARSIGQIVAGAFANLLLMERLADSNQELRLLAESSLEFGASLDLDRVLGSVATRMCLAAEASCCDIYAIEGSTLSGLVSTDGGEVDGEFPGTTYALADFVMARRAVELAQPFAVADIEADDRVPECERAEYRRFGFRALLELPLIDQGGVIGLAVLFDRREREFAHVDLLRGLGQIAAQAIANARVHRDLDAGAERLAVVNAASLELASSLDLRRILEATARRLCAAARVSACDIYRLHEQELDCQASIMDGAVDDAWLAQKHDLGDWRAARLAVESHSVVNVVTLDDPRLSEVERRDMARDGQKSALIVPLIVESRVIGLAELFAAGRERTFADEEIAMVEAVCRVAALAVTNADLFSDLKSRNQEAELLNRIAIEVGSSLEASTIATATIHELAALIPFTEACLALGEPGQTWDAIHSTTPSFERFWEADETGAPSALRAALLRERVITMDLEREDPCSVAHGGSETMRASLVIGIWIDDALSGALALVSPERDAFATADRHLLGRVGAQLALSFKNARLYQTIKTMHVANLKALISALNARDYYAVGHAARVAAYMLLLGRELGWPDEHLPQIIEASFLHDVGRIGVADSVLFKPGRLSDAETAELRNHPVASAEIVQPLFSDDLVLAVLHHHERWDGTGYPDGLAGEAIPELARALCIVDSYDAMSFQRPHHAALGYAECLAELESCRGEQFDPEMVTAFMRVLDRLDERRSTARAAAATAAARIDAKALAALSASGDEGQPGYDVMAATLREVRDASPDVRFLTSMVYGHDGWEIVCDPEEDPALHSSLGDRADRSTVGADITREASTRNILELDDYGIWVCGIADVVDADGGAVGLVCADLAPAEDWPKELGSKIAGHDQALSTIVESATARLGRARVDAVTDGLTGLYNQRYFKQRLGEEVARATEVGHPLALLFCDLDHFKEYNDRLGHTAGDHALRAVSGVLLHSVRQVDLAARYGGEEFTVILIDTTPAGALEVAERVRAGVAALDLGGPDRGITVSVGVATFPDDAALMEELVDKADWAMYLAKRQGRDRVLPFGPGAHEQTSAAQTPK
jgi:diguanylate cyclase (GGDEF)-like protein